MTNLKIEYLTEVIRSTVEGKRGPPEREGEAEGGHIPKLFIILMAMKAFLGKSSNGIGRASKKGRASFPPFAGQNPLMFTNLKTQRPLLSYT